MRRTWAPKGETPRLIHAFNWKKLSVCAALGFRWDGQRCRLWFQLRPGSYNASSLIDFLRHLKKTPARTAGHYLGRLAGAQKPRDASLSGEPEELVERGNAAGLLIRIGIYSGWLGGVVFGVMMGMLPMIGKMVGHPSAVTGFLVHLGISAVIGPSFAILFDRLVLQ